MTHDAVLREEIKRLVVQRLRLEPQAAEKIEDDTPLFASLGLDSVDALELAVALEKSYGITIKSHEVDKQVFTSIRTLAAFVTRTLQMTNGTQPLNA
jgi:acyl carrier protein